MTTYRSEIVLGKRYRDSQTGFEGHAVNIGFFQHGCERVTLKGLNAQGEIVEYGFDSPEVELVSTGRKVNLIERSPHGSAPMKRR